MAAMLATAAAVAISTSVLSPGLLLDAISLWPGLVPALIALLVVAFRKAWRRRAGAVPPLLIITWLLLASAAHLSAWVALPSSSGELIGPTAGTELATASISPAGRLVVEPSTDDALYQVRFLRLGGPVGVPAATEVTGGTGLNISVSDRGATRWFRYAGWRLLLRPETVWNLNLGGDVSGDLSALTLGSLTLNGSGTVTLSAVTQSTPLAVLGSYVITLPAGAFASVSGEAQVPESWIETEDGFASGSEGEGWIISVAEEGSLRVNQP
jgi:hypothetical protein